MRFSKTMSTNMKCLWLDENWRLRKRKKIFLINTVSIFINLVTVDKENKHYISTAIFQEENTKKFHEKDTPISILIRNPLGIIIFFIVVYILYPRLWKKEYFSKRTLERNNLTIFKTYNSIYYTRYNYINYRRGLYACVRSNFSWLKIQLL